MNAPFATILLLTGLQAGMLQVAHGADANSILSGYRTEALAQDPAFKAFSAARGQAFYRAHPASGKPKTPSCTSCHSPRPGRQGQTRAGKDIAPMAISKSPERYTDPQKVEKWFRRNCNSVLGRPCTAAEKGDFITFMMQQ